MVQKINSIDSTISPADLEFELPISNNGNSNGAGDKNHVVERGSSRGEPNTHVFANLTDTYFNREKPVDTNEIFNNLNCQTAYRPKQDVKSAADFSEQLGELFSAFFS